MGSVNFFLVVICCSKGHEWCFFGPKGVGSMEQILKNLNLTETKEGRLWSEQFFQS